MQKGFAPILIVILIAVLVGGYLIYQNQPKPIPSPTIQLTSTPSPVPESTNSAETTNWKTYNTSKYTIKYPADWKILETPLAGETLFKIKPSSLSDDENYPSLFIEFISGANTAFVTQSNIYLRQGLRQDTATINNLSVTTFSGTSPTKTIAGRVVSSPIQNTFLLFERSNFIYTIGYSYNGNLPDSEQEKLFAQILSTFKFLP